MQSWVVNPLTRDYINQNGSPQESNSLTVPAYFRLAIPRGKWMYAPDDTFGADYDTVLKRPAVNGNQIMETITTNALQPLVDDGRATQVQADVVENDRGATQIQATITDASNEVEVLTLPGLGI